MLSSTFKLGMIASLYSLYSQTDVRPHILDIPTYDNSFIYSVDIPTSIGVSTVSLFLNPHILYTYFVNTVQVTDNNLMIPLNINGKDVYYKVGTRDDILTIALLLTDPNINHDHLLEYYCDYYYCDNNIDGHYATMEYNEENIKQAIYRS